MDFCLSFSPGGHWAEVFVRLSNRTGGRFLHAFTGLSAFEVGEWNDGAVTRVAVLGPVRLNQPDGAEIRLSSERQRRLLAALALHAGSVTDTDVLVELIWPGEGAAPENPKAAVHTLVARLRKALPPGVSVVTEGRGYRLELPSGEIDTDAFVAHLEVARACPQPARQLAELASALALWRGRPFAELDHPDVAPEVARLSELRSVVIEQQAAALLALGRTGEAIAALESLAVAEPLREGTVRLLMQALVAEGRQADAVRAYSRLRHALAEELGLDPSRDLRRLEEKLLRQEPTGNGPGEPAGTTAASPRPRLPVSSFIGRRAEVEATTAALRRCRIVTLCGPGGVGKTRLARHTAAAVADDYQDGVHVIDLEAAASRADLVAMIAAALRLTPSGDQSLEDRIVSVLAVRRQLLVLDTCEHVVEAAASVAEAIATGTEGVDVLATSREPLRADGEQLLRIGPLGLEEASALLADRIRAADPSLDAIDTDAALLTEVARRIDGLPLACELAAARVPSLGLHGVLQILDAPLTLLNQGRRTAASRHRSLRDVVRWSIELLSAPEREVFARLSRFAAAVEYDAVASVGPSAELLADLVDHSLVVRVPGQFPRYGLLETLRAYGRSEVSAGMATEEFNRRHAAWARRLVAEVAAARLGPGELAARHRFDAHLQDLRQAHGWLLATGHVDELLEMDVVLAELGYERGLVELTHLVEESLRQLCGDDEDQGPILPALARILGLAAQWSWQRGDHSTCERRCRRAVEIATQAGNPEAARDAYECWGNLRQLQGRWDAAREHLQRAVDLGRRAADPLTVGLALSDLVLVETYAGDDEAAADYERLVSDLAHETQSHSILAYAAYAAGERRAERDPAEAAPYLEEAIRHGEAADTLTAAYARHTLLTTGARAADAELALPRFGALIDYWHGLGAWGTLWLAIRALAETLSRCGRHGDAVRLLAAHDSSPRAAPLIAADAVRRETVLGRARDVLGAEFDAAMAEGRTLGDARAVALARRLAR